MNASSASSAPTAITYRIDPSHTLLELSAKHMMFTTVKGRFTGVTGTIVEAPHDRAGASSVDVEIDASSLSTGDDKRDAHLRSPDFLDVEKYPRISFKSTRFEGSGDKYKVIGDLTVHGTTREVTLDTTVNGTAKNPFGKEIIGFSAETEINRKDFGLNWNVALEAGGVLVSDKVKVVIEIQAVRED
ncbi:MAG: YceI family protein [Chloroflexota bacterium]|nr:YceI family protein [Chloroflexota bacterium]